MTARVSTGARRDLSSPGTIVNTRSRSGGFFWSKHIADPFRKSNKKARQPTRKSTEFGVTQDPVGLQSHGHQASRFLSQASVRPPVNVEMVVMPAPSRWIAGWEHEVVLALGCGRVYWVSSAVAVIVETLQRGGVATPGSTEEVNAMKVS